MRMRISIILMALALLVAYTIPAMSDDCARQGGQSCGKTEAACDGQCSDCACEGECDGDCAEGCECGCGEECGEGSVCAGEKAYAPMHGQYREGKRRGRGMGMWRVDKKGYYLAEKRDIQRLIDEDLKLCPFQKLMLAEASDDYTSRAINLQKLYFDDRSISIENLNHRLTLLNHSYDRHSRMMLSQFQDTVYPEHMWMIYSSQAWSKGYHPGSSYVLRELLKEYERDFEKRHGRRGEWVEDWRD